MSPSRNGSGDDLGPQQTPGGRGQTFPTRARLGSNPALPQPPVDGAVHRTVPPTGLHLRSVDDLDTVLAMLGRSLKGLRQARGWTLTVATYKIASLAGAHISRETLRLYEEGARGIPIRRLFQIAAVYQVSAVGLLADAVEAADDDPMPLSGNEMATITIAAHWQLEEVAYLLSKGKISRERLDTVADGLTVLAALMRKHQPGGE